MVEDVFPVRWAGTQAVVALPEHIGIANAGQIREQLLSVINRGAVALIADMTATVSCDQAGADAMFRAFRRASASGTELRLVVTARLVARILAVTGLDRLVSIYPSLEAAAAASTAPAAPRHPVAAPAAVVLADGRGTGAAVSRELEDLFGHGPGELPGRPAIRPHRAGPAAALAREADAAEREYRDLLGAAISGLYRAGLSLQASLDGPADAAGPRVTAILADLDAMISRVRDSVAATRGRAAAPPGETRHAG